MNKKKYNLAFSDTDNTMYDAEDMEAVFMEGYKTKRFSDEELIALPYGSYMFSLPERHPVYYDSENDNFKTLDQTEDGSSAWGAACHLASGYLRTALPAYRKISDAEPLPMWAYSAVVFKDGEYFTPAIHIDEDPRSNPELHENRSELKSAIKVVKKLYPENRLVNQLGTCSRQYNCLCARNFFLGRYEAPLPTSPACNARCTGCLSQQQEESGFVESQPRLNFKPSPKEISQVILHHFNDVEHAISSFGQGCEGEPLLRGNDLAKAIALVRKKTTKGTINCNTNGSKPEVVNEMIEAGLNSIRISFASPTKRYYERYHNPVDYSFENVIETLELCLKKEIFVSINLFFMPGFTDARDEVSSLRKFLKNYPVNMIQTRNMNMDPDLYFETMNYIDDNPGETIGIANLIAEIRRDFPAVRLGYYNPSLD